MLLADALELSKRLIETGEKHTDYAHVVDLAETYRIFITGKNIEKKLIRYARREDAELFAQRVALTQPITPAVSSSIRQPFNKVTRNDRIRKTIDLKTTARKPIVEKMATSFYGAARKKNKGLEYWLKTRFIEMVFIDPNSWTVVEWDTPQSESEVITPRPFEVSASMAHNFFIANDEVKWLFVCQDIKYMSTKQTGTGGTGTTNNGVITGAQAGQYYKLAGQRFTLYDTDNTIVFEQVDPEYLKVSGYELQPGEALTEVKEISYLARTFQPKVGYVPAFRNGYKRDEETNGRTFVNPWHDALCYFNKSLKTVSELDLTFTLHAFPQKLQYVQKCSGSRNSEGIRKGCSDGYVQGTTNQVCPSCKGNGWKVHTSAQDAIYLPMPDDAKDMINLEDILVYKAPPVDLIKLQNEYTLQLEQQAHQAVFNSQVFVKKSGGGMTESKTSTATEADFNMQSVYDALEPFTEKYSEMWREFITIFAVIAGEKVDSVDVSHEFPADYKLKTGDILLNERKTATDSGSPAFLIETIDDDLAAITYAGDALGLQKYRVKRRYYPFSGKNESEVALLLASEFVPKEYKILYSNFDLIFKELEQEAPEFWTMTDLKKQRDMVTKKVAEWVNRLDQATPTMTLDTFNQNRPTDQNNNGGDGNQGNPGDNTLNNPDNQNK